MDNFRVYMENTVVNFCFLSYDMVHKKRVCYAIVIETVPNTNFHFKKSVAIKK